MCKTISVLNQKGGPGKTTLSINIAVAFANEGHKVLIIDSDPQGTAMRWYGHREKEDVDAVAILESNALRKAIQTHRQNYDIIIIDGKPSVNDLAGVSIFAADLVLVPIEPAAASLWSADALVDHILDVQVGKGDLVAKFILNKFPNMKTTLGAEVLEYLEESEMKACENKLHNRIAYADSMGSGSSILEWNGAKAKTEFLKLFEEIKGLING